jgi:S1-C subfamily serine protease
VTLADGTEIPADIVLRDADLDLAFVRLKMDSKEAKGATLTTVNLKEGAKAGVLDEVVVLGRTDEGFNRRPCVVTDLIIAELKKPRQFFKINCPWNGAPVFQKDGKVIGVNVNRLSKGMRGSNAVLPAEDIVPIAEQALRAKPEEPKADPAPAPAKPAPAQPNAAPAGN